MKETRKFSAKALVLVCALTLALCCAVGGTLAWLVDETEPVVNTFTYGDINIELTETDTGDGNSNTNEYVMKPGNTIIKDPKVTVLANSENSWVFVKLVKSENFDDFMEYEVIKSWQPLDGYKGVYYQNINKATSDQELYVLVNNKVTVKGTVTKEMLNALDADSSNVTYPTLTVTAYAVQRDAAIEDIDTAAEAWALIQDDSDSESAGE